LANQYLSNPSLVEVDAFMPLHLSEELSPRFSRAKRTRGFNIRREARLKEREGKVAKKLAEWEEGGRDEGLMSSEEVRDALGAMGEVKVRGRTREEVRDAKRGEEIRRDQEVAREVRAALARGLVWDGVSGVSEGEGGWRYGDKAEKTERKQRRKALKEDKVVRRMERMTL
jgi:large subunit ribosomal protein L24